MDASWQPDPTGRHQYRWWDGAGWTESVADNGQNAVDPIGSAAGGAQATVLGGSPSPSPFPAAAQSTPAGSSVPPYIGGTPGGGTPLPDYSSAPALKQGGKGKWIALALVAVAALGVVGFLVLGGGDGDGGGSGVGRTTLEITNDDPVVTKTISLKKGESVRVRVEPLNNNMDIIVGLLTSSADANDYVSGLDDLISDEQDFDPDEVLSDLFSDPDELFSDGLDADQGRQLVISLDDNGSGDAEADWIYAPRDITFTVAVGSDDEAETGKVVIIIEEYDGDAPTDYSDADETFSETFFTDTEFYSDYSGSYTGS